MTALTSSNNLLLDNLTTAVILVDQHRCIRYLNTAAEIMLSKSLQQCYLLPIQDILIEVTDTITLEQALKKQQPCTKHDTYFMVNNHEIIADYTITPMLENEQHYAIIELVILNTLRIHKDEMLASQQEGNKLLIRGLAHEIKNPLGGIRGVAQLLAKQLPDEHFQEYTHILIEEVDRLTLLVNKLLGSNSPSNYQKANIHEVLEHVYNLVLAESQNQITLIKDYDPSIPEINMDPQQMIQAILNIVRNAMEALITSHVTNPQITLKTRILRHINIGNNRHKMVISIDIIDNGPGVPTSIKDTLFYPMVSGRAEGTGLGLAITQNIISQHKGMIEYNNQTQYTKFSILLPLEQEIANHE